MPDGTYGGGLVAVHPAIVEVLHDGVKIDARRLYKALPFFGEVHKPDPHHRVNGYAGQS
jgi:hypothetical protein